MNYLSFCTGLSIFLGVNAPQLSRLRQISSIKSMFPLLFPQSFQHRLGALCPFCFGDIDSDIHFSTDSITNTKKIMTDSMLLQVVNQSPTETLRGGACNSALPRMFS